MGSISCAALLQIGVALSFDQDRVGKKMTKKVAEIAQAGKE
jgi:hypothetical protein